jgi:hypothetical protein
VSAAMAGLLAGCGEDGQRHERDVDEEPSFDEARGECQGGWRSRVARQIPHEHAHSQEIDDLRMSTNA